MLMGAASLLHLLVRDDLASRPFLGTPSKEKMQSLEPALFVTASPAWPLQVRMF